eukprot:6185852-Pleurochrysis_carterae.AAC.1
MDGDSISTPTETACKLASTSTLAVSLATVVGRLATRVNCGISAQRPHDLRIGRWDRLNQTTHAPGY